MFQTFFPCPSNCPSRLASKFRVPSSSKKPRPDFKAMIGCCSTFTLLLICSSFSRENCDPSNTIRSPTNFEQNFFQRKNSWSFVNNKVVNHFWSTGIHLENSEITGGFPSSLNYSWDLLQRIIPSLQDLNLNIHFLLEGCYTHMVFWSVYSEVVLIFFFRKSNVMGT